eukprot:TRINITY_DN6699_c0_g1_i1.p3 TRINITY_DN6699_c0_g1~~TRINITY_DN6699_c0_g1_i1.p3  ORF type:complete len:128 (+),score=8.90 TRINITY_DN6699_c0_g1_i1:242-625(+)
MFALQYMEPEQLAGLLKGPEKDKAIVIDVRSHDFGDIGFIKGCLNIPSDDFEDDDDIDNLIQQKLNGSEKIIMHCQFSKQRGPHCAYRLQSRLKAAELLFPEVYVLRGGFQEFGRKYLHDGELVVKT